MNTTEVAVSSHQGRIRRGMRPERRSSERVLSDLLLRFKRNIGEGVDHRAEKVIGLNGELVGAEFLLVNTSLSVDVVLRSMMEKGTTFNVFAVGIMKAFESAKKGGLGYRSVNAYLADITHPDFRYLISKLLPFYTKKEQSNVVIELLEYEYGNLNGEFINNIKWLRGLGFRIKIDDCDILGIDVNGISMEILKIVGGECEGIKIDHKTSDVIAQGQLSKKSTARLKHRVKTLLSGGQSIIAEGIKSKNAIAELHQTLGVTKFQLAPQQYWEIKEK